MGAVRGLSVEKLQWLVISTLNQVLHLLGLGNHGLCEKQNLKGS